MAKKLDDAALAQIGEALGEALGVRSVIGTVEHDPDTERIVLPTDMSPGEARQILLDEEEQQEALVEVEHRIQCFPIDGAYHFFQYMKERWGQLSMVSKSMLFWTVRPRMISVTLHDGSTTQVPWGRVQIRGVDGELDVGMSIHDGLPYFVISGEVKRKDEAKVVAIAEKVEERVKEQSIYRGHAIELNLEWIATGRFNPVADAPKFIDVGSMKDDDIILNQVIHDSLATSILARLQYAAEFRATGRTLANGIVMYGEPGTGKTLTLRWLGKVATENGWTFLMVRNADHITHGLRLARMYQPAVLAAEDIDQVLARSRDAELNLFLQELDGVANKGDDVVVVATTNFFQSLDRTSTRAGGRMGHHIRLGAVDAGAADEFIRRFIPEVADPENVAETTRKIEEAKMVPAFLSQALDNAISLNMYANGGKAKAITCEEIDRAVAAMAEQIAFSKETPDRPPEVWEQATQMFAKQFSDTVLKEVMEELESALSNCAWRK